ncbi:MAG TPA: hypothetical protein VM681_01890 [Candidatus Thermoplasmatota archaeon]|nr:hypothetical protein [Candidatus Thermoplasmatota archaeon]
MLQAAALFCLLGPLAGAALASPSEPVFVCTRTIVVGHPATAVTSVTEQRQGPWSPTIRNAIPEGIDGFYCDLASTLWGSRVTTVTDNGGVSHDLDIHFFGERQPNGQSGPYLGGCATNAPDEVCTVPVDARQVLVVAYRGLRMTVTVASGFA